ncbi:unnamed protein product [Ilex paraguariensis]|uniref:Uncharacterized protein n=1 Tax=Ilex paraguariensis TaxID=185542 RepID=A0ABC8R495_9AQUA
MRKCLQVLAFEDEDEDEVDEAELFGAKVRESFVLNSLSSSFIVSNIFEARWCLMTPTNFDGATSVTNLARRELAIILLLKVL